MGREVIADGAELDFVDFGGGFGVPYREDVEPLDMEIVGEKVREAVGDLDAQVKLEPGRYVVADAECILTEVNTVKETPAATVVGVDASLATLTDRRCSAPTTRSGRHRSGAGGRTGVGRRPLLYERRRVLH